MSALEALLEERQNTLREELILWATNKVLGFQYEVPCPIEGVLDRDSFGRPVVKPSRRSSYEMDPRKRPLNSAELREAAVFVVSGRIRSDLKREWNDDLEKQFRQKVLEDIQAEARAEALSQSKKRKVIRK